MTKDYVINPDRFKNFFNELDTHRTLLTTVTDLHTKLFNHFASLEKTLNQKSQTLNSQIQKSKETTEKALESLRIRENLIPQKEVKLAASVQQLKNSAISDIETGDSANAENKTMSYWLRMLFRRMDCKNLLEYMLANKKKLMELRMETAKVVEEAVDLLGFVLEAVEEFVDMKVSGNKTVPLGPIRSACGILVQTAFAESVCGVSSSLKERALRVLEKWKGVLSSDGVSSGEANMFVTLVIGFGLKGRFDIGFLRNLVLEVASKRDMAKLAMALGPVDKMGDVIEELVKTGKEFDAVHIALEAGLTDRFPPGQLLKKCLTNCLKIATNKINPSKEDISNELSATKAVMKCIEEQKVESEFDISSLKKQISRLEKANADKKKGIPISLKKTPTPSSSNKRPRETRSQRFGGGPRATSSISRPPKSRRVSTGHQRPTTHQPPVARYPGNNTFYTQQSQYLQYANYPIPETGQGYGGQMNYGGYDYNANVPSKATYNV